MNKIIDYRVIQSYDLSEFERHVEKYIKMGWEPLGGVSVAISKGWNVYCQAIVKKGPALS